MGSRKCIYTNKEARATDNVVPRKNLGDEVHNWANDVPVCLEYKYMKEDRLPTDLELEAQETFYKLESAKLRVKCYEERLAQIQEKIKESTALKELPKTSKTVKKDIKKATHEKEIIQPVEEKLEKELEKRKKIWD